MNSNLETGNMGVANDTVIIPGKVYRFMYTNWKGKVTKRYVVFEDNFVSFGRTSWHNETNQLFLSGTDKEKDARRSFCAKDIDWDTFEEVV